MLERIKELLEEQLSCDVSKITEETSFQNDLGLDSLDLFELVMALEDEYDIKLPSKELERFKTIGDVMHYIKAEE